MENNCENRLQINKVGIITRQGRGALGEITNKVHSRQSTLKIKNRQNAKEKSEKCHVKSKRFKEQPWEQRVEVIPVPQRSRELNQREKELNAEDKDDILFARLYSFDIYNYLLHLEKKYPMRKNHLENHKINESMREFVLVWLFEVQTHFRLQQETIELTITVMDRYTDMDRTVNTDTIQLVALASLFITVKYEEVFQLDLTDLTYICDDSYTDSEILDMERKVLTAIKFILSYPTPTTFLKRYLRANKSSVDQERLAQYFIDLALTDYQLSGTKPSKMAASAVFISSCVLSNKVNPKLWTTDLVSYSSYVLQDFQNAIQLLAKKIISVQGIKQGGIHDKHYSKENQIKYIVQSDQYTETLNQFTILKGFLSQNSQHIPMEISFDL